MKYEVYAQDEASGLYAVKVIVNDSVAADEKQSGSVKFDPQMGEIIGNILHSFR